MDSTTSTRTTSGSYTINIGKPPKQYGWICPLCGRANAPWLNQCPCKPITTWTFTSPTTNTKDDMTWSDYRVTDE